ncbi:zinc ribbon domain-containing protein [bacterium]|nr:zinc ribbon domain-containing protein [bacterium]
MLTAIMIMLALTALIFVFKPLLDKTFVPFDLKDDRTKKLEALINHKNKIYADIKDLDFEFGIGKMAENDYRSLRGECLKEVSNVMKQIDALQEGVPVAGNGKITDAYIEDLIRQKRQHAVAGEAVIITSRDEMLTCSSCGRENHVDAKFCSECGTKLVKN